VKKKFDLKASLRIVFYLSRVFFITLPSVIFAHPATHNAALAIMSEREISPETIDGKITSLTTRTDLTDPVKNKVLTQYHAIQENLRSEIWFNFLATSYQEAVQNAPSQLKLQREKIAASQTSLAEKKVELFASFSLEMLEKRLLEEKSRLNDWDVQLVKISNEVAKQESRPQEIRQETDFARQSLDEASKSMATLRHENETELEREAAELQLKTLVNKLTSELKSLGMEAISQPVRLQLLKARLQELTLQKQVLVPVIAEVEKTLATKRQLEAQKIQQALVETEKNSLSKHPVIQVVTKENIGYSREWQVTNKKLERVILIKDRLEDRTLTVENDLKSAERKITLAGLSPALGKILREQRRSLDDLHFLAKQATDVQTETAQTSLTEFKVESRVKQLTDLDGQVQQLMRSYIKTKLPEQQRQRIAIELRLLLVNQKGLLDELTQIDALYLRALGDYDFAQQQLQKQVTKYALYLDERLLWVVSSAAIDKSYAKNLYLSIVWFCNPQAWQQTGQDLLQVMREDLFLNSLLVISLIALLYYRSQIDCVIGALTEKVTKLYTDQFNFTVQALAYTLFSVAFLPLIFFHLGWCLTTSSNLNLFSIAVGTGLRASVVPLFFLQFFYQLFKNNGVVQTHFNWESSNTELVATQIGWLRLVTIPAIFLIHMTGATKNSLYSDSLGRLGLIVSLLSMAWVLLKILHPKTGLIHTIINEQPDSWVARLRYVWYPTAVLSPLIICGFAVAGYYLSALELQQKFIITLRLIFIFVIAHQLVLRWLTLVDRQLALKNARQKRKAATGEDSSINLEELLLDIPKINQQMLKILEVSIGLTLFIGFWMIWKNIFPAFSFLEEVVLWQHSEVINNQEVFQAITLNNLVAACLYIFVMTVTVINFPGVMEVFLLRQLSIEAAGRYAINQLARYILITIGCISVANELGGSWTQVQWLVAALSVGLGFGLQEIFANLVSGIILLFERPIRVGDTITIGEITGKVSKIQMRATHIVDWDEKSLIIPNKTFITDQVHNWTLNDKITRVSVTLGIAYKSDVTLAHQVICETVRTCPQVLTTPEPCVYFVGFGASSLDFVISAYVNEIAHRMPVTHDLHCRLFKAFAEHKIEIPLPQRDIHLHSTGEFSKKSLLDTFNPVHFELQEKTDEKSTN